MAFLLRTLLVLLVLWPFSISANTPEDLSQWREWILEPHSQWTCPFIYSQYDQKSCYWPSSLKLDVTSKGMTFEQLWQVYADGWVALPGSNRHWPMSVEVDGESAVIVERQGQPGVLLSSGNHRVAGRVNWRVQPQYIHIPPQTGLYQMTVNGVEQSHSLLDEKGQLWISQPQQELLKASLEEEEHVGIRVFRKLIDDVPFMMETEVQLDVSGKAREMLFGKVLFDEFEPISIRSDLPARIEKDGRLRVQVRPGQFSMRILARHKSPDFAPPPQLVFQVEEGLWPDEEIWVVEAKPNVRRIRVDGVASIDPNQTLLPPEWRGLPAYRLKQLDIMKLTEQMRGDPDPASNQLSIQRELWLDFNGQGMTIKDQINGQMNRGWRLEMGQPYELGRLESDGEAQVITQMERTEKKGEEGKKLLTKGIEIRDRSLNVQAVSRLESVSGTLPALGWLHDFQNVHATLHLPPGWRAILIQGVDSSHNAWVDRWSLWDIFIVVIVAVVVMRLFNLLTGLLALVTFALIYHEANAPVFSWLNLLAVLAVLTVIPEGKFRKLLLLYRSVSLLALVLLVVPFAVQQMRIGFFPQLERPYQSIQNQYGAYDYGDAEREMDAVPMASSVAKMEMGSVRSQLKAPVPRKRKLLEDSDPNASAQTGPGLPAWRWNQVQLNWSGPVSDDQNIQFWLTSPLVNQALKVLSVLLVLTLLWLISGLRFNKTERWNFTLPKVTWVILACCILLPLSTPAMAEYPSSDLLKEYESRLLEAPDCLPQCASITRTNVSADNTQLEVRLRIDSAATVDVPVLKLSNRWRPQVVLINGEPAQAVRYDAQGQLRLALQPGLQDLLIMGNIAAFNEVQLGFALDSHNVRISAQDWVVSGLSNERLANNTLVMRRKSLIEEEQKQKTLAPDPVEPMVRVIRTLRLGLNWYVETQVERIAPLTGAIQMSIPLVEGESVTSEWVELKKGEVQLVLNGQQKSQTWYSSLQKTTQLTLSSAATHQWVEEWRVEISPVWHMEWKGIAPIKSSDDSRWIPHWRPWPGESLTLYLTRPAAVEGKTFTIQNVQLDYSPGQRQSESTLNLKAQSSRGEDRIFVIPREAKLTHLEVDGQPQPFTEGIQHVNVSVNPGEHEVQLKWRQSEQQGWKTVTPEVDLGIASVNLSTQLNVPRSRWVLFAGGPLMGPAVMFWSVLGLVVLAAYGLSKQQSLPLGFFQWLLLGIGMSTAAIEASVIVIIWFFALSQRKEKAALLQGNQFNVVQVLLVLLTVAALVALVANIPMGLLGQPDMGIRGNGSSAYVLQWFQDRSAGTMDQAWMISAPMWLYRVLMLAWSLWLAFSLIRWLKWGWSCFSEQRLWRSNDKTDQVTQEKEEKKRDETKPEGPIDTAPSTDQ